MSELREESDYEMSNDESQKIGSGEKANRRITKSDRELGCIYSVKWVRTNLRLNEPNSRK